MNTFWVEVMEALVTSYRRSRHKQYPNQILIKAEGVGYAKAHELLGKKVAVSISGTPYLKH